jgi:hypothetical protein
MEVCQVLTLQPERCARPDGMGELRLVGKTGRFSGFCSQFQSSFLALPACMGVYWLARKSMTLHVWAVIQT